MIPCYQQGSYQNPYQSSAYHQTYTAIHQSSAVACPVRTIASQSGIAESSASKDNMADQQTKDQNEQEKGNVLFDYTHSPDVFEAETNVNVTLLLLKFRSKCFTISRKSKW